MTVRANLPTPRTNITIHVDSANDLELCTGECASHSLLASHNLAPPLLARFSNGLLYRFMRGKVAQPSDLRTPEVWRSIARRLAEWHATIPIDSIQQKPVTNSLSAAAATTNGDDTEDRENGASSASQQLLRNVDHLPTPNIWTVMQRWAQALPDSTAEDAARKTELLQEVSWLSEQLGQTPGIGGQSLVFSHCDLLCANVILQTPSTSSPSSSAPSSSSSTPTTTTNASTTTSTTTNGISNGTPHSTTNHESSPPTSTCPVSFIDYEYATPAPAAFDIANHFAEWGGFDCDFSVLPTLSQRRDFLTAYLAAYNSFKASSQCPTVFGNSSSSDQAQQKQHDRIEEKAREEGSEHAKEIENEEFTRNVDALMSQVDAFRGAPGFYWGIWALIQQTISHIDFDYGRYAALRLCEYWAWKDAVTGDGKTRPDGSPGAVREGRWFEA